MRRHARLVDAERDLRWYFGSGPETAAGACGLRSPLGSQLEILQSGISPVARFGSDEADDEAIDRLGIRKRWLRVRQALGACTDKVRRVLHLAFAPAPDLPGQLTPLEAHLVAGDTDQTKHRARRKAEAATSTALLAYVTADWQQRPPSDRAAQEHQPSKAPRWRVLS